MSTTLLIGTSVFTSGSIVQDFSTHILVSVDHSRAYMKLKRLLSAILMTSGIKRCMVSQFLPCLFLLNFFLFTYL
uniref:Uncharacterized protein n=1 Tax=Aegilops tauschii subsp. strangulata TaxID=200361 RepID=A0A453RNL4_AEGTS